MTLDEAIQHCEEVAEKQDKLCEISVTEHAKEQNSKCASEHRQLAEWLKELKAYREQSGDAISRQAMHIELEKWITYGEYKYSNATKYLYDRIDRLPSVTPQQRTGRWIFHEPFDNGHKNCNACIECSQCHTWLGHDCYAKTPYCPICGSYNGGEEE